MAITDKLTREKFVEFIESKGFYVMANRIYDIEGYCISPDLMFYLLEQYLEYLQLKNNGLDIS